MAREDESEIKAYYDGLAKNELMARRCKGCGKYTFPPTGCCEHCGSFSVEWARLSGRGTLLYATHNITPACHPRFEKIAPYVYGQIRLEEGIIVQAIVSGIPVTPEALEKVFRRGEIPVVASVMQMEDLPVLTFSERR